MNKQLNALLLIVLLLFVGRESFAQWNTPTIETTVNIGANDYGTSNNNSYVVGGQTWFLTWDGTYLHGQLQDANETESAVIYLDLNPIVPINGGGNTNGNISGISFGGLGAPNLPFRADAVITFNNTDRRLYRANGSGGWTLVRSGLGGFGGGSDDVSDGFYGTTDRGDGPGANDDREFRITWNDLTGGGGLPSQFAWFGYVSYTNGLYAPVPERANPNGTYSAGAVLDFTYYMNVSSTVSGSSSNPMSQTSYTHLGGSVNFGGISIFDFTLNETGTTITRDNTSGGTWTIAGQLIIHDGTIDHNGTVNTDIVIDGNLVIGNNGSLILESTTPGADLYIGGDFTNNGTFNCNNRAVFFDGNGLNQPQTIRGDAGLTIDYMFVETTGDVRLDNHPYHYTIPGFDE